MFIYQSHEYTPVPVANFWNKVTNNCLYITFVIEAFRKFCPCFSCLHVLKTILSQYIFDVVAFWIGFSEDEAGMDTW